MKTFEYLKQLIAACLLLFPIMAIAASPESVGQVARVTGGKVAEAGAADGTVRKLAAGDVVYAGERIRTGATTGMQIEFTDKARFILGPNAEFEVEEYILSPQNAGEEAFHSRVIKGAFRFVSGLIAKSKGHKMTVSISVATIGIRGTHVEGEVSERKEEKGVTVDASAKVMLLKPEDSDEKTSIVVENTFGSVLIDKPGYGTEIPDEKSPPSPVRKMQLRTIDNIQRALRSTVRQGGTARPRMP
jgi:FecR protein